MSDHGAQADVRPLRRDIGLALVYLALAYLFGGSYGLVAGGVVVGAWRAGAPRWSFWAAAMALMAAAPVALMAQGLPSQPVAGPDFGSQHLVAHVLVGLSLAVAGFAALRELVESRPGRGSP